MAVSYKKLWKLLIDLDMKKMDLAELANISSATITKMSNGNNVNIDSIAKICIALNCDIGDVVEIIPDENN